MGLQLDMHSQGVGRANHTWRSTIAGALILLVCGKVGRGGLCHRPFDQSTSGRYSTSIDWISARDLRLHHHTKSFKCVRYIGCETVPVCSEDSAKPGGMGIAKAHFLRSVVAPRPWARVVDPSDRHG